MSLIDHQNPLIRGAVNFAIFLLAFVTVMLGLSAVAAAWLSAKVLVLVTIAIVLIASMTEAANAPVMRSP